MLDPDLFMAQLKKPEVLRGEVVNKLSTESPKLIDYLRGLSDLSRKTAEVLMEYERFLREDLAAKPIRIRIDTDMDVKQLINKLDELYSKVRSFADSFDKYEELVSNSNFNLLEVDIVVPNLRRSMKTLEYLTHAMKEFFPRLYNLFATTPMAMDSAVLYPKNLFGYASEARRHELANLVTDIEEIAFEIGKRVFDPQVGAIVLDKTKVKSLYLLIDTLAEKFDTRYDWQKHKIIKEVSHILNGLRSYFSDLITEATRTVEDTSQLRDALSELGYRSPSQRLTFFLPSTVILSTQDVEQYLPDELTFPLFFNDLAYVIHRVAEMLLFYSNYLGQYVGGNMYVLKFRRCDVPVYSMTNSGSLINFAIAWLNSICHLIYSG